MVSKAPLLVSDLLQIGAWWWKGSLARRGNHQQEPAIPPVFGKVLWLSGWQEADAIVDVGECLGGDFAGTFRTAGQHIL